MFIKILFWNIVFQGFQPIKISLPKIGNGKVVKILFPGKMIRDLLKSDHFFFNLARRDKKKC